MVKTIKQCGAVLVLALLVSACGPAKDSPEGVVNEFFNKIEDRSTGQVQALLCQDYRQNVDFGLKDGQHAKLKFDFKYKTAAQQGEQADTRTMKVYGKYVAIFETEHVRVENKQRRDEEAAWSIQLFKVDGQWRVCGGDPGLLSLLDLRAVLDGLE
jgi:major membrane immunogen (membrane-anchored lipoprotein)